MSSQRQNAGPPGGRFLIGGLTLALCATAAVIWQAQPQTPTPGADPAVAAEPAGGLPERRGKAFAQPAKAPAAAVPIEPLAAVTDDALPLRDDATENVLGIEVRRDRNCTVVLRYPIDPDTGEMGEAYECVPDAPTGNAYATYSNDVLGDLAFADADAAGELGLRFLRAPDKHSEAQGLALVYRSAALSSDAEIFHRAMATRYPYTQIDDEPQLDNLRQGALFASIARRVGGEFDAQGFYARSLAWNGVPREELDAIEKQAQQILSSMADIQENVSGASDLKRSDTGERDNA